MKSFLITLLFFSIAVVAYSQTSFPGRGQCYKSPFSNNATSKAGSALPVTGQQTKNNTTTNAASYKNDGPVISVIPALRLWLLPGVMLNPFVIDED